MSESSEIDAFISGDSALINRLYDIVFPKILAHVLRNKGSEHDAKEVFHDALFQIMVRAKLRGITIKTTFDGYVYTVCKNLWYKELNKRKREVKKVDFYELHENTDAHVQSILDQERLDLFKEMMLRLSDKCKELLKDYFGRESYTNIVKKFSYASESVAFQQVYKCKKRLRDLIVQNPRYKNLSSQ